MTPAERAGAPVARLDFVNISRSKEPTPPQVTNFEIAKKRPFLSMDQE